MQAAEESVVLSIDDGVAWLTLNRPSVLNAFSMQMLVELRAALKAVAGSTQARCLVLTGSGRAFCAGSDLSAPRPGLNPADPDEFMRDYYLPAFQLLAGLDIPTVAAVNGPAVGAGMSLALMCDIAIAAESAFFLQPFVGIGLVPDLGSSWFLPHLVGKARATALMLLSDRLPARTAEDWGLIWRCVGDAEFLDSARSIANRLAGTPHLAISMTKRLLRQTHHNDLGVQIPREIEFQRTCFSSPDAIEARTAFAEKRKPVFGRH